MIPTTKLRQVQRGWKHVPALEEKMVVFARMPVYVMQQWWEDGPPQMIVFGNTITKVGGNGEWRDIPIETEEKAAK